MKKIATIIAHPECDVNYPDSDGDSSLNLACIFSDKSYVQLLLTHEEIDVNHQNKKGQTPLMLSCLMQDFKIVKLLIQHEEIDLSIKNKKGLTAFDVAKKTKNKKIINLFQEEKSPVINEQPSTQQIETAPETPSANNDISITHQTKEDIALLSTDDLKKPENKAMLDKYVKKNGFPALFTDLSYEQQKVLLNIYAPVIRKNQKILDAVEKIICAQHTAQKVAKRKSLSLVRKIKCYQR